MIGIIADTHDNVESIKKAMEIFKSRGVDFAIHCGDIVAPFTIQFFKGIKFVFIKGNCDGDVEMIEKKAKEINDLFFQNNYQDVIDGKKIIALHGDIKDELDRVIKSQHYDYVFYGHTHYIRDEKIGTTRVINPGAHYPTLTKKTIVIADLGKDKIEFVEVK